MKIILASSSKYRQNILNKLHLSFEAIAPDIDESAVIGESVEQQVLRLAINKAKRHVTFSAKDYRRNGRKTTITLAAKEFKDKK